MPRVTVWNLDGEFKPLLVGEDNPYSDNPHMVLYPHPPNSAGGRLCLRVLGMTMREYLGTFDRANLTEFRRDEMWMRTLHLRSSVFLLGAKVCRHFRVPYAPWSSHEHEGRKVIHVLPHPSGRCRTWNEAAAIPMTRQFVTNILAGRDPHKEVIDG